MAGFSADAKLDMVQVYLANEKDITFPVAKAAVIRAYSRIGSASPFDVEKAGPSVKPDTSQNDVNAKIVKFLRSLQVQPYPPPAPPPQSVPAGYQKPPNQAPFGSAPHPRSYPKQIPVDIICHNCMTPGHFSNNCQEPQVSYKQKAINWAKVKEMTASGNMSSLPQ